jgi:transposase
MARIAAPVVVSEKDIAYLKQYVNTGKRSARSIKRARVLLHLHEELPVEQVVQRVGVSLATLYNIKQRYLQEGLSSALHDKAKSGAPTHITSRQEAQLTALACSEAPAGYSQWSLRLLSDKMVELGYVEHISHEQVRKMLKKVGLNLGSKSNGV